MSTTTHATCQDCDRVMNPGTGCTITHVAKSKHGPLVKRVFYGEEADDWGAGEGRPCHDCNAGPGTPHHAGCDVERCAECGNQMLGCLGPPDEFGGCGWLYLKKEE
jgi:hypothetical protein